jgi:MFS family permease
MRFLGLPVGSAATFTPTLLVCYLITFAIHVGSVSLNTLLPFHMVDLGGSRTQVGLLFSVATVVSMVLRPTVGGWVDRFGARPVMLPGVVALAVTSLALHGAATPTMLIALMVGLGLANGLITTPASVLTAIASPAAHRGEALGTYYLAGAIAIALGPPLAFALRAAGGMALEFVAVTVVAVILMVLVARLPGSALTRAATAGARFRVLSVRAVPVSGALVLATLGHASVYGFLPLYAVGRGQGPALVVFFTIYPLWLIACRALLRGVSDRFGHARVAMIAMTLVAVAYLVLALPPTLTTLVIAAVILATGSAVLYPSLVALLVDRSDDSDRGLAIGTLSGAWDLGVVVGSALIGVVADRISFGAGFAVGAVGAALGVVALGLIEARRDAAGTRAHATPAAVP